MQSILSCFLCCSVVLGCSAESTSVGRTGVAGQDGFGNASDVGGGGGAFGNPTMGVTGTPTQPLQMQGVVTGDNCNQDVDVVFVVDVSGSMIPPLTFLQDEVSAVDAALLAKNLPTPHRFGLVLFVDDVLVMNGGEPYSDVGALQAAFTDQINLTNFTPARQVDPAIADNLSWPENTLDALIAAANGFKWRDSASTLRTIIHVTDASFWDLTQPSAPGEIVGPHFSMYSYTEAIDALRAQDIWVNTFAAKTGGPPGFPLGPPSHGAFRGVNINVGIGFFEPYNGMNSIAVSTGGLSWDIDEVFDGIISLADPINQSIADRQCVEYPPPPPPPD